MNNERTTKQTQGNKKLNQMIGDLQRNAYFLRSLKKIADALNETDAEMKESDRIEGVITDRIVALHEEIDSLAKLIMDKQSKVAILTDNLSEKYGIDPEILREVIVQNILQKGEVIVPEIYDMCRINDFYDEQLNPVFPAPSPVGVDLQKQREIQIYPVHLEIHKFATKRELLRQNMICMPYGTVSCKTKSLNVRNAFSALMKTIMSPLPTC
jgi:ribosomal protein S6